MVGIGVLLAAPPGAPAPTIPAIQLASTGSALPLSPATDDELWWLGDGGSLFGSSGFATPTPTALAAASLFPGLPPIIGPGGWLIGDGLDADPLTCTAPCDGGNGGLLWGNGGDGALGGACSVE